MAKIDLNIEKLVGYTVVEADGKRVMKLGSTKLGCKLAQASENELAEPVDRRKVDA